MQVTWYPTQVYRGIQANSQTKRPQNARAQTNVRVSLTQKYMLVTSFCLQHGASEAAQVVATQGSRKGSGQFREKCPILTSETEVAHITFVHIPLVWTSTKRTPFGCEKSWKIHSPPGYPHRNYTSVTMEEEDFGGQMAIAMAVCPSGHHVPTLIPK